MTTSLADVQTLALEKMAEHGLIEKGWYFSFDRAKKRNGCCKYNTKTITMSSILTPTRPIEEITNTILHEIAHALVGSQHGHGPVWRSKAIEIGSDGARCSASSGERPEFRWYSVCETCNTRYGMHRAPGRVRSCTNCAPWGFSFDHLVHWEQWGVVMSPWEMPDKYQNEYSRMITVYKSSHSTANHQEDHNV